MQTRSFTLKVQALDGRRVRFIASTADLDTLGTIVHPDGCDLSRFIAAGNSLPLLWNHDRADPANVLGKVVEIEVRSDAVVCVAEFRESTRADEVLGMVRDGTVRACSIGFCDEEVTGPDANGVLHIVRWTFAELSVCPVGANPKALAIRSFTLRLSRHPSWPANKVRAGAPAARTPSIEPRAPQRAANNPTGSSVPMDPKTILEKLGLAEGAKPEEIAAALVKYMTGADSAEDKQALVLGVLGMLAPATSSSSASDGAKSAAAEALADEVRKLQARVAEMEGQRAEAEKAKEETPEQRADAKIASGQWPIGQRDALVKQYAAGKEPFLLAEGTFSQRSQRFTTGGGARKPTVEPPSAKSSGVKDLFSAVEKQLAAGSGVD